MSTGLGNTFFLTGDASMGHHETLERKEYLDKIIEELSPQIPEQQKEALREFVYQYYFMDIRRELNKCRRRDLLGSTLSFWKFIQHHDPERPEIEVLNPDYPHHGWHSTHTILRLIHRDMPFLVDSLRMKLNERGLTIHNLRNTVIHNRRDSQFNLVFDMNTEATVHREAIIFVEIDRQDNEEELEVIAEQVAAVMADVARVVEDYRSISSRVEQLASSMVGGQAEQVKEFLNWLLNNNFTFLGYEELKVSESEGQRQIIRPSDSLLGLLRTTHKGEIGQLELEPFVEKDFFEQKDWLSFSKAAVRSSVHRPAYPDFITVRQFAEDGSVVGEARIVGLYTSPVYRQSPFSIPYINHKAREVIERSGLDPKSHHGKDLEQVLEVFPRDELFQTPREQLFTTAMSILRIQERKKIRIYIRQDPYGTFCSALVFVPRDVYSTSLRLKMEEILCQRLCAVDSEFTTYFSESVLARVHFIFKLRGRIEYDLEAINDELTLATRSWIDEFRSALLESNGEAKGNQLVARYASGFSAGYKEAFSPESAVVDVEHFERINEKSSLSMGFYRSLDDEPGRIHFKLYHYIEPLPLADQIPIIENLGLRVLAEYPYLIRKSDGQLIWIHDFLLCYDPQKSMDIQKVDTTFKEAFEKVWFGEAENDRFNLLVLACGMSWRQVAMLRSYSRYIKQIRMGFSQTYIAETLCNNIEITRMLVALFETRFNPELSLSNSQRLGRQQQIQQGILETLDQVTVLTEDQIVRRFQSVIMATLRTNFYQLDSDGNTKSYISYKLSPREIPDIPKPTPLYEIFVYSPRVEGIHLRGGKVARGGLRWSDRVEDYRTEVLGLVKAQQVKNALIVPVGAKGGFVAKQLPVDGHREAIMEEGVACYQTFIRALLDITDNLSESDVIHPKSVVFYDDDDTYLVVAADKGTATFSDVANEIAHEYDFWLGDAFASGGSVGYDHKKMGITAKGAWVSVQRHFRERGVNVQEDPISVIGVGDMSGDVFGNGMLSSETLEMVAAFNHQHIFVDPNPDVNRSYLERLRLFNLPRSSWQDYDKSLISKGGGIFSRNAKSVTISNEMKERFDIKAGRMTPNELIRSLLRAPVDLIWNGGIGTYVKAINESHADVGDKANDPLRINGCELRAKVVGEGGNLGLSQLGRVEYSLQGGALNTDFIDNSGGVDCSDHEVNIKILLNDIVASGDMTVKQRNALLEHMTDDVSRLVLSNNYRQTQALSLAELEVRNRMDEYRRFMEYLEGEGKLDRSIEFLPDNEALAERLSAGQGLTRPELSLLISYSKADLKEALISSDVIDEPYMTRELHTSFPDTLVEKFSEQIDQHRLRREIVATQTANHMIDMMGITHVLRVHQTTGASAAEIARAFMVSREVFGISDYWQAIENMDNQIPSSLQQQMMVSLIKLTRRASRWFIQLKRQDLVAAECIEHFGPLISSFIESFTEYLSESEREELDSKMAEMNSHQVPKNLAKVVCSLRHLLSALSIIQAADQTGQPIEKVARTYFAVGERLELNWYSVQLGNIEVTNHWQSLARNSIRDELTWQQIALTVALLNTGSEEEDLTLKLDEWMVQHQGLVARWQAMLSEIRNASVHEMVMFTVANRELMGLAQASSLPVQTIK
ncbi:NAD-glutamate dehydrogenase [Endozoicomonas sp. ALD040]|uniref:NAD-glutamate dehydrogenase n=1 Tax=Endozoicomonas sp. ALD040 TaxID=3403079 RepID=UPI003BB1AF30